MIKTISSAALLLSLGAGGALTVKDLLGKQPDKNYRAHHVELDATLVEAADGGVETQIRAKSYVTAFNVPLPDGGSGTVDLSTTGNCPLTTKAVQAAAKLIIDHGSTPACR